MIPVATTGSRPGWLRVLLCRLGIHARGHTLDGSHGYGCERRACPLCGASWQHWYFGF